MTEEPIDLGPDPTLLLVDDDEPFVKRLAKAMEKRGFEVETASSVAAGKAAPFGDILIDQGLADQFYEGQLKTHLIEEAAAAAGAKVTVRRHEGYDHSYFFIATFIADHIAFHAARL